jgi:hypothetical protein
MSLFLNFYSGLMEKCTLCMHPEPIIPSFLHPQPDFLRMREEIQRRASVGHGR